MGFLTTGEPVDSTGERIGAYYFDMRKSFVLYTDNFETIRHLSDEQLGKLTRMIYEYATSGNEVKPSDPLFFIFNPVKMQLDRDFSAYEKVREKRSVAGKNSASKRFQQVLTSVESVEQKTQVLTDNVTVTVTDNVTVTDTDKKTNRGRAKPFVDFEGKVFFKNTKTNDLFIDFLRQRKANKQPVTERALTILIDRAKRMYKSQDEFISALEDSISNNWKTFYEPKTESKQNKKPNEDGLSRAWSGGIINKQ